MAEEIYHSVGKRKTSVARIWMRPGTGQMMINKRSLDDFADRDADRNMIMDPLRMTNSASRYDILINVKGGGISGQAGAIRHGISRALVEAKPELRDALKKQGFLTRDSRMKERKKYGQPGARKRFQYSKR